MWIAERMAALAVGILLPVLAACLILSAMAGCAIPALTGLKEVEYTKDGNSKYTFMTGADFHIGANGIDRVDDKRGIKPNGQN